MILHSFYTTVLGTNKGFFFLKGIWILVLLFGTQFLFAATNLLLAQTDTTSTEADKISKQLIYDTLPRTPLHFSEAALEKYRGDKDFDYSEVQEDKKEGVSNWITVQLRKLMEAIFGSGAAGVVGSIWRWGLAAFALIMLLRFLILSPGSSIFYRQRRNKGAIKFNAEEHIIHNEDIDALIKKARAQGNFRLAVRYYYLGLLKNLIEKGWIVWANQKTNTEYLHELEPRDEAADFSSITRAYEYVWYGNFEIDDTRFRLIENRFLRLNDRLR